MKYGPSVTVFLIALQFLVASCGKQPAEEGKPIAKVNDYVINEANFRRELAEASRIHQISGLSRKDKQDLLNTKVKKELLIQEAAKLGLDKEDAFRQIIERYWEQTLIRTLLKQKAVSLEKDVVVTQEEIKSRYQEFAKSNPVAPSLKEMTPTLEKQIREEKKTKKLESWVNSLWEKAEVVIYNENLNDLR